MASLLIIGGTGFFGKSILDFFNRNGLDAWSIDKIFVMARNPNKLHLEAPELLSPKVELIEGDIASVQSLPYADYVIHAAASTDASKYLSHGDEERKNIIMGTLNYCRLAPLYHQNSKIVFCSSGAVYGRQPESVRFLAEDMCLGDAGGLSESKRSYAYAKRDSEKAIEKLGVLNNMNVSIARCFAFVGKYLPRDQHFAIGNFIGNILSGKPIVSRAEYKVIRTYMHSDDLVIWLMTICSSSNAQSPTFNVGSSEEIDIRTLAVMLSKKYESSVELQQVQKDFVDRYVPELSKAMKCLNLSLHYDLMTAIESTIDSLENFNV